MKIRMPSLYQPNIGDSVWFVADWKTSPSFKYGRVEAWNDERVELTISSDGVEYTLDIDSIDLMARHNEKTELLYYYKQKLVERTKALQKTHKSTVERIVLIHSAIATVKAEIAKDAEKANRHESRKYKPRKEYK
jgi:hypothetical protein